jgi:hypothetical protein
MQQSNFHNVSFLQWMRDASYEYNAEFDVKVYEDKETGIVYIDIHDTYDKDSSNVLESFSYMDMEEIDQDIEWAEKEFNVTINTIKNEY